MTIRSIAFSPDSGLLLTAADDGHMKLFDFESRYGNVIIKQCNDFKLTFENPIQYNVHLMMEMQKICVSVCL